MKRKLFTLMLLAVLGANAINAAELIDGIYYNIDKSTRTASVSGSSNTTEIIIPEKVVYNDRDYAVTSIEESAFNGNKSITSVSIPATVLSIGSVAFFNCKSLNSVTIAEGCEIINPQAFYGCSELTKVEIPGSVARIEAQAFANCTKLTEITLNEGLTYIGDYAFGALQNLMSITIPSTITEMGIASFYNCRRLYTVVWNAVKCIGWANAVEAPFTSSSEVVVDWDQNGIPTQYKYYDDMTYYDRNDCKTIVNNNIGTIIFGEKVEHIPSTLCCNWKGLKTIIIPDNVKEIGAQAFASCHNLSDVKLGNNLNKIGNACFNYCKSLSSISVPNSVTSIGANAFKNSSLKTITLGKGITEIGNSAFPGITTINIYALEPPIIDKSVVTNDKNYDLINIDLNVRSDAIDAYKSADVWKEMSIDLLPTDIRTYTLTVLSNDNNMGETDPSGEKKYDEDDEVTIKALPKGGYQFSKWNDGNKENPRIIKMVGDLSYTAIFETYNPTSGNAYQVNISGENCSMNISSQYPEGSVVTIEAVPDECLEFKQWSDGNKDNPRTITVTADGNYKAEFNKITYTITGKADQQNGKVNIVVK